MELPAAQYEATPDSLTIRDLPAESPFEICVTNYINPQVNTQLMGLYRTNGVYCTQCEAEGFRRITYFPDRPDVLAPYTVTIIAAKEGNPLLLSNGNFLGGGNYDEAVTSRPGSIRIRNRATCSLSLPAISAWWKILSRPCPDGKWR